MMCMLIKAIHMSPFFSAIHNFNEVGTKTMDKLDIYLILPIYLFRMNLTLLSFAIVLVPTSLKLWISIKNGLIWIALIKMHIILFVLK